MTATLTSKSSNYMSIQQVQGLISTAERDIRRCLRQVGQSSVAQSDLACREIGKRIAGIEANLKALTCDEETMEFFHDLTRDLRCLTTRVAIAARQAPALPEASKEKVGDLPKLLQDISKIEYSPHHEENLCVWPVFIVPNETGQDEALDLLDSMKKLPKGGHLGVSGLYNWDIIAQMKSEFAVLVDYMPSTVAFNRRMVEILAEAKSPEDFVQLALKQMEKDLETGDVVYATDGGMFNPPLSREEKLKTPMIKLLALHLDRMLSRKKGALSQENFPFLQKMAKEGRIIALGLDLCDTKAFKTIADAVHGQGFVFSSLYFSNAYDYMQFFEESPKNFQNTADVLKQDGTCIVDSDLNRTIVHYGKDPLTGTIYNPKNIFEKSVNNR